MNIKNEILSLASISMLAVAIALASCSKSEEDSEPVIPGHDGFTTLSYNGESKGDSEGPGISEGSQPGNTQAGVVTAGEWRDLTHWTFWSKLMLGNDYSDKSNYWEFFTNNRFAVKITDESGNALAGVNVKLLREGDGAGTLWETITDNHGLAECWLGLFQHTTSTDTEHLRISLNDVMMDGHPVVCPLDSTLQSTPVNEYVCKKSKTPAQQADIAFIVDATGSMSDEIDFLKQDLMDIINNVKSERQDMKMRTAALFYRDEGDEYVTRHDNFDDDISKTVHFVEGQEATGGGDYPEAVHTALERMLQNLSWDTKACTRLAFLVLDAPPHHEDAVIRSLQQSIATCAKLGIKIIPVAASGVDKNTEFILRFFANATGGTYVFLTDDSGVGYHHIAASVGDYKVEQLNKLLIRLIEEYTE